MHVCFKNVFEALFPCLWKKNTDIFTQKQSACQISVDSEQLKKSQQNRYIHLPFTEPFNLLFYAHIILVLRIDKIDSIQ